MTLKCELLPDQLWIRVESPSHNWLLTDPTLGQLLHVHPASIHSAPPAVPPLALQCRECFMNFAAYEANGVATRFNLSAKYSSYLTDSGVTALSVTKSGQQIIPVFGRKNQQQIAPPTFAWITIWQERERRDSSVEEFLASTQTKQQPASREPPWWLTLPVRVL